MNFFNLLDKVFNVYWFALPLVCLVFWFYVQWRIRNLRLSPDLIPYQMHGVNIRTQFSPNVWAHLRKQCLQDANHQCEICGAKAKPDSPLECHEKWRWRGRTQYLVKLMMLCSDCHKAKHIGRTRKLCGMHEYRRILKHMAAINDLPVWTMKYVVARAHNKVRKLTKKYKLDVSAVNLKIKNHSYSQKRT